MDTAMDYENELLLDTVKAFMEAEIYPHEDMVDKTGEVPKSWVVRLKSGLSRQGCTPRTYRKTLAVAAWVTAPWR